MSDQPTSLSLSFLRSELSELKKDHEAFVIAYDAICRRIVESSDHSPARSPKLLEWSGSRAVCGTLELSIHAIERTIAEYESLAKKVEAGDIQNSDRPHLSLVGDTE